jgi:hypothetical protein
MIVQPNPHRGENEPSRTSRSADSNAAPFNRRHVLPQQVRLLSDDDSDWAAWMHYVAVRVEQLDNESAQRPDGTDNNDRSSDDDDMELDLIRWGSDHG